MTSFGHKTLLNSTFVLRLLWHVVTLKLWHKNILKSEQTCCMNLGELATDTFIMFEEAGSTEIADVSLGPAQENGK